MVELWTSKATAMVDGCDEETGCCRVLKLPGHGNVYGESYYDGRISIDESRRSRMTPVERAVFRGSREGSECRSGAEVYSYGRTSSRPSPSSLSTTIEVLAC